MKGLTADETGALISTTNEIYLLKTMIIRAYERLTLKAKDERTRRLLEGLSTEEADDNQYWAKLVKNLSGDPVSAYKNRLLNRRVWLMMSVLGSRGFLQWAMVAEDDFIEDLTIKAGFMSDTVQAEKWARIASDEWLHLERMKEEVLGMESWEMSSGGGVRDIVFGANDGLVSVLALVAGVFGAATDSEVILIAGIAGAIAGTISMGAGSYLSAKSEREVTQKENQRKGIKRRQSPEDELSELVRYYIAKGFGKTEAEMISDRVQEGMMKMKECSVGEELGLVSDEEWDPTKAGLLTGLSFLIASVVPVLPFVLLDVTPAIVTAVIASIISLFIVGASKSIFTRMNWIRSGLEMMIIGTLAAAATYIIGLLIPT